MSFHDVRFPTEISLGASGGPERRTDVVTLGSGYEERNARWADSRRRYNTGYGVRSLDDLHEVIAFFEARRGRLYGFRWRDPMDWKSCPPQQEPSSGDVILGVGDGATASFPLIKTYGSSGHSWSRTVTKPVASSLVVAVDGAPLDYGTAFTLDPLTGVVTFTHSHIPSNGQTVSAGFEFDVPVRFDTDQLDVSLAGFRHGSIPNIPIVELRQ